MSTFGKTFDYFGGHYDDYDISAKQFLTAASITNLSQKRAINKLVKDLKAANIWDRMHAIYPLVGGTANSNKFNLKDPRDADDAFRLTFGGTITHSAEGMVGDGTTGYANTNYNPSLHAESNSSINFGVYFLRQLNAGKYVAGCYSGVTYLTMYHGYTGGTFYGNVNNNYTPNVTYLDDYTIGWYNIARSNSTQVSFYKNGVNMTTQNSSALPLINNTISLLANHGSGTSYVCNSMGVSFAVIGKSLTDQQQTDLWNIIKNYQESLYKNYSAVVFDGNSIVSGPLPSPDSATPSFPARVDELLMVDSSLKNYKVFNAGFSGSTITQRTTQAATPNGIRKNLRSYNKKDVLVFLEIINEWFAGTTKENIITKLQTYFTTCKNAGFGYLFCCTAIDQKASSAVSWQNDRDWINDQIRTTFPALGINVIDLAADSRLMDANNLTYFGTDKLHPRAAGQQVIAEIVYNAIKSSLAK